MSNAVIDALLSRRSVSIRDLTGPGPNAEQITTLLACAHRVPDHGKLGPWKFIVFQGQARRVFGDKLAEIFEWDNPEASDKLLAFERERFTRAPLVIAVVSSPVEHKVPEWEQMLSAGAACQNLLIAATAMGFGAQWVTEWCAYNDDVNEALELNYNERIAGFIYIGNVKTTPEERPRPSLEERLRYWK